MKITKNFSPISEVILLKKGTLTMSSARTRCQLSIILPFLTFFSVFLPFWQLPVPFIKTSQTFRLYFGELSDTNGIQN